MQTLDDYQKRLQEGLRSIDHYQVDALLSALLNCWNNHKHVFICGNGGSAANAQHLANDLIYGIAAKSSRSGMRVTALPSNGAIMSCLANDTGYENTFSNQLKALASPGDLLITFSGSGNSPNILNALEFAKSHGMQSVAVLGFSGGKAKTMADIVIHSEIDDMQVSEDIQMIVGHMLCQNLCQLANETSSAKISNAL